MTRKLDVQPTAEQQAVIDAALSRENLVVQAGAGTGKTSTLQLVAEQHREDSLYVAYNKAIATDAEKRFLPYVKCKTSHSLAFGAVGRDYSKRLNGSRQPSWEIAKDLGLNGLALADGVQISVSHMARIAQDTVRRFCYSADPVVARKHVPFQNGVTGRNHEHLATEILPVAEDWWLDLNSFDGHLPFEHDHYLKMWALTNPVLKFDVIFLDEAQDSNPVLADLIRKQTHAQQIVVGDGCQQMYAWRGAVDAMSDWPDAEQLYLSQSWRFGDVIADEANKWLTQLNTPLRLTGNPGIESSLGELDSPHAILCRTNAGALNAVISHLEADLQVALVGGGDALARLARAAGDLKAGRRTNHPELYAFPDWESVIMYTQESGGRDLLPLVNLINAHGVDSIIKATQALVPECSAQVVVSTVHKAKGREWDTVRVADDFFAPAPQEGSAALISPGEAMVGYVAVSRAKHVLDRRGVAWIDELTDQVRPEEEDIDEYRQPEDV